MDNLQIKALCAGVAFGIWPLVMSKSGLSGNVSSLALSIISFFIILPFAFKEFGDIKDVRWTMGIIASVVGAIGIMGFNGMLSKASPEDVSGLFVLMILAQISIPALYQVWMGHATPTKYAGFALAATSAFLLTKK